MSAPIALRRDFSGSQLRGFARKTKDGPQARRLLALAAIYDGATRSEAAKIGGVGLQIVRDWVLHFNARGPEGLLNGKSPGHPPKLNDTQRQAIAGMIESGPIPAVHGVVRWRLIDLAQWIFEEFRITIAKQTLSRELRAMGYRKLSARPHHHAQAEGAIEDFKKVFPRAWRQLRARTRLTATRSKSGSPTRPALARRTRSPAAGPSAAPAPARHVTSEPLPPTSSARSAQNRARAQP
jgi:transposase